MKPIYVVYAIKNNEEYLEGIFSMETEAEEYIQQLSKLDSLNSTGNIEYYIEKIG